MDFKPIATGFCFLEAPRVDGDVVYFSDLLLGGIRRLRRDGSIDVLLPGKKWIGGIAINEDGTLLCGGGGGLTWVDPATGKSGVLLGEIDGKPIEGVNDIFPDDKGGLYFGTVDVPAMENHRTPGPAALYRLDPDGRVTQLWDPLRFSNGIGISPDGKRLYHSESLVGVFAYDILPDGRLANRTSLIAQEDCDGLAVDREGGIWFAGVWSGAIIRVLPNGTVDRRETLPVKDVPSLCFGGADDRDVYVATGAEGGLEKLMKGIPVPQEASLYHGRSDVAGMPVPRTRFRLPK